MGECPESIVEVWDEPLPETMVALEKYIFLIFSLPSQADAREASMTDEYYRQQVHGQVFDTRRPFQVQDRQTRSARHHRLSVLSNHKASSRGQSEKLATSLFGPSHSQSSCVGIMWKIEHLDIVIDRLRQRFIACSIKSCLIISIVLVLFYLRVLVLIFLPFHNLLQHLDLPTFSPLSNIRNLSTLNITQRT